MEGAAISLSSLSNYKTWAGITSTDATRDAALTVQLQAAEDAVKRFTRSFLEEADYTIVMDAPNAMSLRLPQSPVSLTDFSLWSNADANGDPDEFDDEHLLVMYEDYVLDPSPDDVTTSKSGIVRSLRGYWGIARERPYYSLATKLVPVRGALKITYTAGYATIPPSIVAAVHLITAKLYAMRKLGLPLNSENLNGYGYSTQSAATANGIIEGDPTIRDLLMKFGRPISVGSYS